MNERFRFLFLITTPKLAEKAIALFHNEKIPVQYKINAEGTATSEIMDMLGLGSTDKNIIVGMMPKKIADEMLGKLAEELKLGTVNSGIAFTVPLTGTNSLMLKILMKCNEEYSQPNERKEDAIMTEAKHSLIAAIVNRGYCNEVMDAARGEGASGGSVIHSRRFGSEEISSLWGLSVQEEKEIVLIVADAEHKVKIMQAIGEKCGMHSEAMGIVFSLPIEAVVR